MNTCINRSISGLVTDTIIDIELENDGTVEIYTDAPKTCCVAVVKLDERGLDDLIDTLLLARQLIKLKGGK